MPYDIGDRVIVDLRGVKILGVSDLGGKTDAVGTVVEKPGGLLYNVRLDAPLAPDHDMVTFIGGRHLRPVE
jgi:hypothetical protein